LSEKKFKNSGIEELQNMPPNTAMDHYLTWFQICVIMVLGIENMAQDSTNRGRRTFYTIPDVATLRFN
jgi:hypothetical protein